MPRVNLNCDIRSLVNNQEVYCPVTEMPVAGRHLGSFKLPVQVSSYDGLSWSPDSQLGIATRKGVYVFEVCPDMEMAGPGLHCIKTFVSNETGLENWHLESVLSEEELCSLEREDRTEVMMDRILSPHMAAGEVTFKQPSKVRQPSYST